MSLIQTLTKSFKKNKKPAPKKNQEKTPVSQGSAKIKNIIAVASGKGGVGKSTTAVCLARSLAHFGFSVGLLDADIYGPSLATMTQVEQPSKMLEQKIIPPQKHGIKVISSSMFSSNNKAQILRGPMAGKFVTQFINNVYWGELDFLILDYPPGTGDIQLSISQQVQITGAVIVTTPQQLALQDAKKAIFMFDTLQVPIVGIIETMSFFVCDGCDKKHYIFSEHGGTKLSQEYGFPLLGQIPLDKQITQDSDTGLMFDPLENNTLRTYQSQLEIAQKITQLLPLIKKSKQQELGPFTLQWQ